MWTDLADATGLELLVPVGSCEQHGPHLPLDTDTRIAVAVARAVADATPDVVVAPAITIGASGEHQTFAGTLSIGTEALTTVLVELGRSALPADGSGPFGSVTLVNGHGGNHTAVTAAVTRLRSESRAVTSWVPRVPDGDAHAGRTETSLLLHIAPDAVGPARPVGDVRPMPEIADLLRSGGVEAVSANGVLGDAREASAGEGRRLFEALVDDLSRLVRAGAAGK